MIGKKIKKIRLSRSMTQSELAGDKITRNMLSQIENGSATPSLATILYISEKLGMPAGYFLADEKEEPIFSKIFAIEDIKNAYGKRDLEKCINLCQACEYADDEINMILCECYFGMGTELLAKGRLVSAHKAFNDALHAAEKTAYNVETTRASCYTYLDLIGTLSPEMKLEITDDIDEKMRALTCSDPHIYSKAVKLLEKNDTADASMLLRDPYFEKTLMADHVRAKIFMAEKEYKKALDIMNGALSEEKENKLGNTLLFGIYSDMEICYRELKDFENAYIYATKKADIFPETVK